MGFFDNAVPFKGQKYKAIKKNCVKKGELFKDPVFPASGRSLYHSKSAPADIVWKRPGEISDKPKFFEDGVSSNDLSQGEVGNCWFVAACACLADDKKLWKKIMPDFKEQEWSEKNKYAGIFHFRFWRCGEWQDVVIDDLLPTRNGRLIFVHSKSSNEFWSALLEKAYAKLAGDYESMESGRTKDALADMTGGSGEVIVLKDYTTFEQQKNLFRILENSKMCHSLMGASIAASDSDREAKLSCGLVKGHAYSFTAVRKIKLGTGLFSIFSCEYLEMMRLRNPWGGSEWTGAWSDGSNEWGKVSSRQKKDMGLTFDDDGEFWMTYEDFVRYFTRIDICHIINLSMFSLDKRWHESVAQGEWHMDRCGGCGNKGSVLRNPQYVFDVIEDDDEVMISLEQKDKRVDKKENYTIGFTVLKTDTNRTYRMHDELKQIESGPFETSRSVFKRINIKRGKYLIIPSTFGPGELGPYVLRMYGSSNLNLTELMLDEPPMGSCLCFTTKRPENSATQITIAEAEGLESQEADPYCIVKWEGKNIETQCIKNTRNPKWNERVTLYRKKPDRDIIIEVLDKNLIKDELLGFATISMDDRASYKGGDKLTRFDLYVKGKENKLIQKEGCLWLNVLHTENMASV